MTGWMWRGQHHFLILVWELERLQFKLFCSSAIYNMFTALNCPVGDTGFDLCCCYDWSLSVHCSIAEEAIMRMVELLGPETLKVQNVPGRYIVVTELDDNECKGRVLHLECGDMFDVNNIDAADIVMMETDVPLHLQPKLCQLLSRMRDGSRVLSYLDFRRFWSVETCPFTQMENNRHLSDRFPTSWSVQRGHHFYLWTKVDCVLCMKLAV